MNRKFTLIILLVCALTFLLGIAQLFKLRFEGGDVYPEYSSLRPDPLGTSAYYESLERVPALSVRRDYTTTDELPTGRNVAYLHLAGSSSDWAEIPQSTFNEIQSFLMRGGRLVVAFFPETEKPYESVYKRDGQKQTKSDSKKEQPSDSKPEDKDKDTSESKHDKHAKKPKKYDDELGLSYRNVSLKERWGVEFKFKPLVQNEGAYEPVTVVNDEEPSLPKSISWHSGLVFTNLPSSWHTVYSQGNSPVLIERKFGPGSVVFSTDSYFLSNEALQKERHAELLAWLIGPAHEVVFDEAHLGITQDAGVATLMRQYHLHGLVLGLLLLAGLFIWKNSFSLVPIHETSSAEAYVAGKDSGAGFVNLLRRNINARDLIKICQAEWKKSQPKDKFAEARLQRVTEFINAESSLPENQRNPVKTYLEICRILNENRGLRTVDAEPKSNT
ncbi:DUF4350 domain-containing protein [Pedosphaera parvula]|uniref:DUF4350 domain-containing protein n=1 Tax=Pedosphaera parvula (strain Ellin514) TaxID=320771 RepID=B9XGE1_PEDPL|nr:DUF4350 domain-containing protein [Pedosphaera parvula]EEF60992.1 conserved hypothetical protein [Pedosphaera parvula Ellin514]